MANATQNGTRSPKRASAPPITEPATNETEIVACTPER